MQRQRLRAVWGCVLVAVSACGASVGTDPVESESAQLGAPAPDVVLRWNEIAVNTAVSAGTGPVPQVRFATIAQLAVFEAVNTVTRRYQPYLGTFSAPRGTSPQAGAVAAAHRVLVTNFPAGTTALDTAYQASLAAIPDGPAKDDGVALGTAVADAVIALRAHDGSSPAKTKVPGPPGPGEYQATASCPVGPSGGKEGSFYQWKDVTPFVIATPADFPARPPPALESARYAADYLEVLTVGSASSTARPQDRADVVHLYASAGPAYLMNLAARQLALAARGSLTENARNLALMNMAMSDGFLVSYTNKYRYNFWRPETAIHAGDTDGNPLTPADPTFAPFIVTPCYPSYPSNQGTVTNAAVGILHRLYGGHDHQILLSFPGVPGVALTYTRLSQFSTDVADARVYGGIHFRFDQVEGQRLGKRLARAVYGAVLRPMHHRWQDDRDGDDDDDDDGHGDRHRN